MIKKKSCQQQTGCILITVHSNGCQSETSQTKLAERSPTRQPPRACTDHLRPQRSDFSPNKYPFREHCSCLAVSKWLFKHYFRRTEKPNQKQASDWIQGLCWTLPPNSSLPFSTFAPWCQLHHFPDCVSSHSVSFNFLFCCVFFFYLSFLSDIFSF